jgi:hypothetical protein
MKSKVNALIVLAVIFVTFSVLSSVKAAQKSVQRYSTAVLKDGGGPLCIPHTPCGYSDRGLAREKHAPATILLADGTGPMCPPRTGCGYRDLGLGSEERISPTILLADGTGPMCPPTTGCGYKKRTLLSNRVRFDLLLA